MNKHLILGCCVLLFCGQFSIACGAPGRNGFSTAVDGVASAQYREIETKLNPFVDDVTESEAVALCGHENAEMRIFAIIYLVPKLAPQTETSCLQHLMDDADPIVRPYAVRRWLASKGMYSSNSRISADAATALSTKELRLLIPHLGNGRTVSLIPNYCSRSISPPRYQVLQIMMTAGEPVRRDLDRLLTDQNPVARSAGIEIIRQRDGMTNDTVSLLIRMLDDPAESVQSQVVSLLRNTTSLQREVSDALTARLKMTVSERLRTQMVVALGLHAEAVPENIPVLIDALSDNSKSVRRSAIRHLGQQAGSNPQLSHFLVRHLNDSDRDIRNDAVKALANFAKTDITVAKRLIVMVTDQDRYVRLAAVRSLGASSLSEGMISGHLIPLLSSTDADMRTQALHALGEIGPEARAVVPKLKAMLNQTADLNVALALWKIEGQVDSVLPVYLSVLQNPELKSSEYRRAFDGIQTLDVAPARVVPTLVLVLQSGPKKGYANIVRLRGVMELLATYGPAAKPALPDLLRIVSSGNRSFEKRAAEAIGKIEMDETEG